uniref:Uncharacterized protein n=1 Tax=Noctiluca scintillans TaxID=2966 RepID=A0A7S0ZRK1_NOCSC
MAPQGNLRARASSPGASRSASDDAANSEPAKAEEKRLEEEKTEEEKDGEYQKEVERLRNIMKWVLGFVALVAASLFAVFQGLSWQRTLGHAGVVASLAAVNFAGARVLKFFGDKEKND